MFNVREFAKSKGVEVVGKLTRKSCATRTGKERWNAKTGNYECEYTREIYWEDEAGNQFFANGYICTADDAVI